jgi:hypothetical protein
MTAGMETHEVHSSVSLRLGSGTQDSLAIESKDLTHTIPKNSIQALFESSHNILEREAQVCAKFQSQIEDKGELESLLGDLKRCLDDEQTRLEIWAAEIKSDLSELVDKKEGTIASNEIRPLFRQVFAHSQTISRHLERLGSDDNSASLRSAYNSIV